MAQSENVTPIDKNAAEAALTPEQGEPGAAGLVAERAETSAPSVEEARETETEQERSGGARVLPWLAVLLGLGLIAALAAFGWQRNVNLELEARIAGLEQDLRQKTALLGAHRSNLGEIRGSVRDLAASLAGLEALVAANPEDGAPLFTPAAADAAPPEDAKPTIPNRLPQAVD